MIALALEDMFFRPVVHEMIDYGYELGFSLFGGAGAYQPFAVSTEVLDSPEKQDMFVRGFLKQADSGAFKAKIKLSLWLGRGGNMHSFLHEIMHFYQDMLGLYLLPLKEQGVMPVMADMRTYIMAVLFCEAWAQIEALRTCRALKLKQIDDTAWRGALVSRDWGKLARFYDEKLAENKGESYAAARSFEQWYAQKKHRCFYERHAMGIYESEFIRFTDDLEGDSGNEGAIGERLRSASFSELLNKIPQDVVPKYFNEIDRNNAAFNEPCDETVLRRCNEKISQFGSAKPDSLHEIKCASAPYLWKKLRESDIANSEIPPAPGA